MSAIVSKSEQRNGLRGLIDELYARLNRTGSVQEATRYSVVLRPGDTSGAPNVFPSWPALYAACSAIQGGVRVLVDDSIVTPVTVPAGTWSVSGWQLVGGVDTVTSSAPVLEFQNGAHLDYTFLSLFNIEVLASGSSPVVVQSHEGVVYAEGALIFGGAGAAFFQGNTVGLDLFMVGGELGDGTNNAISCPAGTGSEAFTMLLYNGVTFSANAVGGPNAAAGSTYFADASTIFGGPQPGTLILQTIAAPTLTFQPGGSPANNVFPDWPTLYFVLTGISGLRSIEIDDSFTSPATVPSAATPYNLDGVTLSGVTPGSVLSFANGATITARTLTIQNLTVETQSAATPVWTITSIGAVYLSNEGDVQSLAAAPFMHVSNGGTGVWSLYNSGAGDGTHAAGVAAAGGTLVVNAIFSTIEANAFTGANPLAYDTSSTVTLPQGAGTVIVKEGNAANEAYVPAVLANWSGSAPTSVANALDRIAAHVGPIP